MINDNGRPGRLIVDTVFKIGFKIPLVTDTINYLNQEMRTPNDPTIKRMHELRCSEDFDRL